MSPDSAAGRPTPTIVLVGLMGAGKTTVGRRLAERLKLPFFDADEEIEKAAGRSVSDIFAELGEPAFRSGERRVIARLLSGEPCVLATGGGAFVDPETRALVKARAVSIWLRVDLPTLAQRVARKDTRPLLRGKDPLELLRSQATARYPAYGEADHVIDAGEGGHGATVAKILDALAARTAGAGAE
jgi:shikimate kinase